MTGLLLLVIGLIVYGSLYPWDFDFGRFVDPVAILLHSWPSEWSRFVLRDIAVNLLLYAPLGLTAYLAIARRYSRAASFCAAIMLGAALSTSMELLQVYDDHRTSSLLDVASNILGASFGALFAPWLQPRWQRPVRRREIPHMQAAWLLAACWFAYQLFPLFPVLSRTRLRAGLVHLLDLRGFSPVEVCIQAAGWFAAAVALEAVVGTLPASWLAAAMLCLPLRIFITDRAPTFAETTGAVVALVLWTTVPEGARLRFGLWFVLSAILLRELEPFQLTQRPHPFSWVPFAASFRAERQPATIVLFGKFFFYGAAIWLAHSRGWPYLRAGLTMAALLGTLEWVERYLRGRTPEITDSVIVLLLTFVLGYFRAGIKKAAGLARRDIAPREGNDR